LKLYGYLKDIKSEYYIVHSGQHYDYEMSKIFFDALKIPEPDVNLNVQRGYWQDQTLRTLRALDPEIKSKKPGGITVFGDCSTTYGGAIAAKRAGIPLTHVECGYRHETPIDPEDYIRTIVDSLSDRLITYNDYAVENLKNEGIDKSRIERSDNFMVRALKDILPEAEKQTVDEKFDYLLTIHRSEHKSREKLSEIFGVLGRINGDIIFPCHPGTREIIDSQSIGIPDNIKLKPPMGYLEFISLFLKSKAVITDSGGMQVEAFELRKKCVTLNKDTCWLHTMENGMNVAVGKDFKRILEILKG
jgi:UDP-N-acetylglucosamine 2-epimerase